MNIPELFMNVHEHSWMWSTFFAFAHYMYIFVNCSWTFFHCSWTFMNYYSWTFMNCSWTIHPYQVHEAMNFQALSVHECPWTLNWVIWCSWTFLNIPELLFMNIRELFMNNSARPGSWSHELSCTFCSWTTMNIKLGHLMFMHTPELFMNVLWTLHECSWTMFMNIHEMFTNVHEWFVIFSAGWRHKGMRTPQVAVIGDGVHPSTREGVTKYLRSIAFCAMHLKKMLKRINGIIWNYIISEDTELHWVW